MFYFTNSGIMLNQLLKLDFEPCSSFIDNIFLLNKSYFSEENLAKIKKMKCDFFIFNNFYEKNKDILILYPCFKVLFSSFNNKVYIFDMKQKLIIPHFAVSYEKDYCLHHRFDYFPITEKSGISEALHQEVINKAITMQEIITKDLIDKGLINESEE